MSDLIRFEIPVKAVGKGRPRVTRRGAYTPAKTKSFEALVAWYGRLAMADRKPCDGPVWVEIEIVLARPKRSPLTAWPTKKPDLDNCAKAVLDALNGIVFADDACVVRLSAGKAYGNADNVRVTVCLNSGVSSDG